MTHDMYQQQILDHYKHPRNFGELTGATHTARVVNPLCGDELEFFLTVKDDKVEKAMFSGRGCTISMASASMLTEKLPGMTIEEIERFTPDDSVSMLGVSVNPARLKCATLSLESAQQALHQSS